MNLKAVICLIIIQLAGFCFAADCASKAESNPAQDEIAIGIRNLFERVFRARHGTADKPLEMPAKRPVFLKPHGVLHGTMTIAPGLPEGLRVGVFGHTGSPLKIYTRISSDTVAKTPDSAKSTVGFSLKVLMGDGRSQDFLTQNHPTFFVDTAKDFLEFTDASLNGKFEEYAAAHPKTDQILKDMEHRVTNVLASTFWSCTPYKLGDGTFVKYIIKPCSRIAGERADQDPDYLQKRLERDLAKNGACFEFQVQVRKGAMPLDQATVRWDEKESVPVTVAILNYPPQDITAAAEKGENMFFRPDQGLEEHAPVGSVNYARGIVYKYFAELRRTRNGVSTEEPRD